MEITMNKTAVFGGSFDPIHNGHMSLINEVTKQIGCDHALVIPAGVSPFKTGADPADGAHRLKMCEIAFRDDPDVSVCDLELYMRRPSYTVNTLLALKATRPLSELYLVCGSDAFLSIEKWHKYREILRLAVICTAMRPGDDKNEVCALVQRLEKKGARVILCEMPPVDISSSEIRRKISSGEDVRGLLPDGVADYIEKNRLYRG